MKIFPSIFALSALSIMSLFAEIPTYEHRIGFGPDFNPIGGSVGYEHVKPDSFYLGTSTKFNKNTQLYMILVGYNFSLSEKDTLTPSVGGAILHDKYFSSDWVPVVSVEYKHRINDMFTIGGMAASIPKDIFNLTVGIPFSIHFGKNRDWDVKIIPAYNRIEGKYLTSNAISLGYSIGKRF
jgi:hypothetical protein